MRKCAVARAAQFSVGGERLLQRQSVRSRQRFRTNLAVDVNIERLLQEETCATDAMIDGGIEVHQRKAGGQFSADAREPIALEIDAACGCGGEMAQLGREHRRRMRVQGAAKVRRVNAKRNTEIGRAAGVVGIVGPPALHVEDVGEGDVEDGWGGRQHGRRLRADCVGPTKAEQAIAREGCNADRVGLVAAEKNKVCLGRADEKANVTGAGIIAARQDGDGAGTWLGQCDAPIEIGAGQQRSGRMLAGAFQDRADKGGTPGDAVGGDGGVPGVRIVGEHARIVGVAVAFKNAEIAPGAFEPSGLDEFGHGRGR